MAERSPQPTASMGTRSSGGKAWSDFVPPKKRLVICCDGTWQSSNHGRHTTPSNIAKLSRAISQYFVEDEKAGVQVCYYDAGVGTGLPSGIMGEIYKNYTGYYGSGLNENVCEAYNFLVNNYCPGDELFFFGFSRGAYTARATAGLVASVGLCSNGGMNKFWEMYAAWTTRGNVKMAETEWGKAWDGEDMIDLEINGQKKSVRKGNGAEWLAKSHRPIIKVVGVFETVGGLGYPENHSELNKPRAFHDTSISKEIKYAFHALSLDERRGTYEPTMWTLKDDNKVTWLEQVWFSGMHVNVGGGSDDTLKMPADQHGDIESRANVTFAWMVDRVRPFLRFDESILAEISNEYVKQLQKLKDRGETAGWALGPTVDLAGAFLTGEPTTRTPAEYQKAGTTHEYIHPSVHYAMENNNYKPAALENWTRLANKDIKDRHDHREEDGFTYVKTITNVEEGRLQSFIRYMYGRPIPTRELEVQLEIPEFSIPKGVGSEWDGNGNFSMERKLMEVNGVDL